MSKFQLSTSSAVKEPVTADTTVTYEIEGLTDEPMVLTVAPATEENSNYYNALLRAAGIQSGRGRKSVNARMVKGIRNQDRSLYSKYVVRGWAGVCNPSGEDIPFSTDDCLELLKLLPNHVFDDLRDFCSEVRNFVKDEMADEGTLVENSPSG